MTNEEIFKQIFSTVRGVGFGLDVERTDIKKLLKSLKIPIKACKFRKHKDCTEVIIQNTGVRLVNGRVEMSRFYKNEIFQAIEDLNQTIEQKVIIIMERELTNSLGMKVTDYMCELSNFVFNVPTEFEAYKAAYRFQHEKSCLVNEEPQVGKWSVRVYEK